MSKIKEFYFRAGREMEEARSIVNGWIEAGLLKVQSQDPFMFSMGASLVDQEGREYVWDTSDLYDDGVAGFYARETLELQRREAPPGVYVGAPKIPHIREVFPQQG